MSTLIPFFCSHLKSVSVELPLFLTMLSFTIFVMANDLGMYRVICEKLVYENEEKLSLNESGMNCWDTKRSIGLIWNNTDMEIIVQQRMSSYTIISSMMTLVPGMVSSVVLGAYSDRHGRRTVILFGIFGVVLVVSPLVLLFTAPKSTPIYIIYIMNVMGGLTGSLFGTVSASLAYLTDTIKEKNNLTVRMAVLQICFSIGQVTGPLVANGLMTALGYTSTAISSIAIGFMAFLSALFLVKSVKPEGSNVEILKPADIGKNVNVESENVETFLDTSTSLGDWKKGSAKCGYLDGMGEAIKLAPYLLMESWRSVIKRREGKSRARLFCITALSFITIAVDSALIGPVFTLYIQKAPLNWAQQAVSSYRSLSSVIRLIGMAAGVFLFKKMLGAPDSLLLFLSLVSLSGQIVLTCIASSAWVLYTATGVGALSALSGPCAQSSLARLVQPNEVGKVYGAFGLCGRLAFLFGLTGLGAIYQATVTQFPSMVFIICGGMLAIGLVLSIWLHWGYIERNKKTDTGDTCKSVVIVKE